jgi:hypothetical protein
MIACADCRHVYMPAADGTAFCRHPKAAPEHLTEGMAPPVAIMRGWREECGPNAALFEPKDETADGKRLP